MKRDTATVTVRVAVEDPAADMDPASVVAPVATITARTALITALVPSAGRAAG
jgi:hypothetical protein